MSIIDGTIVKGIGGFYYINTSTGVVECKARGVFRKDGITPLVGDAVEIELNRNDKSKGVITLIKTRKSELIRPAVANVTCMAVVVALENPKPNTYILDKLLASAEYINLNILICFNKSDLTEDYSLAEIYRRAGFDVLVTSAAENTCCDELKGFLKNEVTVFAGNSGVGKSSLLNRVVGLDMFATGEVSNRVERGRHTTRHSELVELPFGGYIIDTPGFSSFDVNKIPINQLSEMFREFGQYSGECRFPDCGHTVEPGCSILSAVEKGKISQSRHENYKILFDEIKNLKKW